MALKIAIPYSAILDVEKSSAMDFSETIEVKVFDKEEPFSVDSYFFAYFQDLPVALDQIRDAVRAYRTFPGENPPQGVLDTTLSRPLHPLVDRAQSMPNPEQASKPSTGSRFSSLLRPLQDTLSLGRTVSTVSAPEGPEREEFTHVWRRGNIALTTSPMSERELIASDRQPPRESPSRNMTPTTPRSDHTYPPSSTTVDSIRSSGSSSISPIFWSVGVPSWLKGPSRKVFGGSPGPRDPHLEHAATLPTNPSGISEVYSSLKPWSRATGNTDIWYSVLERPGDPIDPEVLEKFRTTFAFDDKEPLLGCMISPSISLVIMESYLPLQISLVISSACYPFTADCTCLPIIFVSNRVAP